MQYLLVFDHGGAQFLLGSKVRDGKLGYLDMKQPARMHTIGRLLQLCYTVNCKPIDRCALCYSSILRSWPSNLELVNCIYHFSVVFLSLFGISFTFIFLDFSLTLRYTLLSTICDILSLSTNTTRMTSASHCFWSLLDSNSLQFLYISSVVPHNVQTKFMSSQSLFSLMHPEEVDLARKDFAKFIDSQAFGGSITR